MENFCSQFYLHKESCLLIDAVFVEAKQSRQKSVVRAQVLPCVCTKVKLVRQTAGVVFESTSSNVIDAVGLTTEGKRLRVSFTTKV